MRRLLSVVLCAVMLCSASMMDATVSANEAKTVVDGIRWFPCEEGRENDEIWEVECVADGCLCQRFTETAETTGNSNYLDTVYGEDGSLTITRNGNDGQGGWYWPRIRTLSMENYPELDLTVANTLYFDFTAHGDTQWNIMMSINGVGMMLSRVISEACGVTGVTNSDADGAPGTYKGSVNLQDAIATIATESSGNSPGAIALQNMKKTYVPQINIFCVGAEGASITINSLYISTPEDTEGANCDYLDMGLIYGDEYYELVAQEPAEEGNAGEDPAEKPDEADTTTTTAKAKTDIERSATDAGWIIGVVAVTVVVAAIVAVVIATKKKNTK